jgi:CelD/BcsL family acetyltransferase involved in cellulose biosynthesis
MRVELVQVHELTAEHARLWDTLRASDSAYANPFFSLEFARIAARSQPSQVAVIEVDNRIVGFWAFENRRMGMAVPIGHPGADHHGPIVDMELTLPISQLLRACKRQLAWFGGLPARQQLFKPFHRTIDKSPIVRLNKHKHSDQRRKLNRLAREVGEVRFELDCRDTKVLEQLFRWKREKCARTGYPDLLEGQREVLTRDLHQANAPDLRGWLSVLWAGDRPLAAHLGPRSERVWHWWVAGYDAEHSRHSPGLLMLHAMLQAAPALGIEWLDFGSGDEDFKWQLSNDALPIAAGTAYTPFAGVVIGAKRRFESALRQTPLASAMRRAVDWVGGASG